VPTGILTVEIGQAAQRRRTAEADPGPAEAPDGLAQGDEATHCRCPHCGAPL
jgi:hypothetical protein